jgi:hypothetical protein
MVLRPRGRGRVGRRRHLIGAIQILWVALFVWAELNYLLPAGRFRQPADHSANAMHDIESKRPRENDVDSLQ